MLLPLLASSGCLYLDGLNHQPSISIADGITSTNRGGMLTIHPIVNDREDGPKGVTVTYRMTLAGSTTPLDPRCDYDATAFGNDLSVRFFRAGIYEVTAIADDTEHGQAEASVMVTITDAPPVFADMSMIQQTSTPDACGYNPAGEFLTLSLAGSVSDADMTPAGCPTSESLSYTWRVTDWPGGAKPVLTAFDGTSCAPPTADSGKMLVVPKQDAQVCLKTDPLVVGSSGMYRVVLDVFDGKTTASTPPGAVEVHADEPPCITGVSPVAGSYVVDRTQLQLFDVEGAQDDRDHFVDGSIGFVWSVRRDSDATWTQVANWRIPSFQLDPSSFGVGEIVHVRVEAIDRSCTDPATCANVACDPSVAVCMVASCVTYPLKCAKWKTWDLELR